VRVAGVQSQSLTVDRQMRRYGVPRIASSTSATAPAPTRCAPSEQLREKLHLNPVLLQLPIGLEDKFEGVVDLITMKAYRFSGANGERSPSRARSRPTWPPRPQKAARRCSTRCRMFSDELTEAILEEKVTPEELIARVRKATIALQIAPVMMGSAYKNKGVQLLLDGVNRYLPARATSTTTASISTRRGQGHPRRADPSRAARRSPSSWRTAASASSRTCASTRAR
jgi:elongation factor G